MVMMASTEAPCSSSCSRLMVVGEEGRVAVVVVGWGKVGEGGVLMEGKGKRASAPVGGNRGGYWWWYQVADGEKGVVALLVPIPPLYPLGAGPGGLGDGTDPSHHYDWYTALHRREDMT